MLLHARASNRALDRGPRRALRPGPRASSGPVPVFFTAKPPVENGILMAGDAAGVIDPFSGEGQAAALASGILAGETALEFLEGRDLRRRNCARPTRAPGALRFARRFAWSAAAALARSLDPRLGGRSPAPPRRARRDSCRFGIATVRKLGRQHAVRPTLARTPSLPPA